MEQLQDTRPSRARRARRFPIRIAVRYRRSAESHWHEGTTENISSSGVLFRTDQAVQPNTPIEIQLMLPGRVSPGGSSQVTCRGVIVRIADGPDSVRTLVLGTRFLNYRFSRR